MHADFQSTSTHLMLCSGKCLRYGNGSQEEEVLYSIIVGARQVTRQIPSRYIEKCIWIVDRMYRADCK